MRFDVHPPLYFAMLRVWMYAVGTSEVAIRSLSGVAGVAGVVVVGFLGRRLAGERAGLAAAALLATAPFAIFMDREARSNGWMSFLGLLGFWICSHDDLRGRRWLAYFVVAAALPYLHLFGVYAVVAHGVWVASEAGSPEGRRKLLHWLAAAGLAALCFVPWLPSVESQSAAFTSRQWYALPEGDTLAWLLPDISGGPGSAAMLALGSLLVLAKADDGRLARLLAAALLGIVVLPTAVSLGWTPMLRDRNVLALLPVLCLAAGVGYARIPGAGLLWVAFVASSFALNHFRSRFWGPREEWREAAQYAAKHWRPGDGFDANYQWLWSYYVPQVDDPPDPDGRTWILRAHDELTVPAYGRDHVVMEQKFVQAFVALVDMRIHEVAIGQDLGPPVWEKDVLHFYWGLRVRSDVVPTEGRCTIGVEAWGDAAGGMLPQLELGFVPADGAPVTSVVSLGAEPALVWGEPGIVTGPTAVELYFVNDGEGTDERGVTADRNAYVRRVVWLCEPA
jgi:hypothetical protein